MSKDERYYVEYLGWKETAGLHGREFTDPIVEQLLRRTRHAKLPKLTLKLNWERIAITQETVKKKSKPEKIRYPPILARDVAFSAQSPPPDADVVACVFLGYNPLTQCAVHVHVYRFDSPNTAKLFDTHLQQVISFPEHRLRMGGIENYLAELGHIRTRRSAGAQNPLLSQDHSEKVARYLTPAEALRMRGDIVIRKGGGRPAVVGEEQNQRPFDSVKEELEYKLRQRAPLLLPPKDYDTVVRRHGNIDGREETRSRHASIVGSNAIFAHLKEEARPFQDGGETEAAIYEERERRPERMRLAREGSGEAGLDGRLSSSEAGSTAGAASNDGPFNGAVNGDGLYSELRPRDSCLSDPDIAMYSYDYTYGHDANGRQLMPVSKEAPARIGRAESLNSGLGHQAGHPKVRGTRSLYVHSAR